MIGVHPRKRRGLTDWASARGVDARPPRQFPGDVPRVVFTDPQVAAVGAGEARFSATAPVSEVSTAATYTHAYAESNGFLTLLSDGEVLTGVYALGSKAGEWLQRATRCCATPSSPSPASREIYVAALERSAARSLSRASRSGRRTGGPAHPSKTPGKRTSWNS